MVFLLVSGNLNHPKWWSIILVVLFVSFGEMFWATLVVDPFILSNLFNSGEWVHRIKRAHSTRRMKEWWISATQKTSCVFFKWSVFDYFSVEIKSLLVGDWWSTNGSGPRWFGILGIPPKNPNPFHQGILQEELLRPEDEIFYVENPAVWTTWFLQEQNDDITPNGWV